tara:strand:+ start:312 stop:524 length:213 start_codon:yes stop_codon:yes gene_type:complete
LFNQRARYVEINQGARCVEKGSELHWHDKPVIQGTWPLDILMLGVKVNGINEPGPLVESSWLIAHNNQRI